jgi:hypothetical protein
MGQHKMNLEALRKEHGGKIKVCNFRNRRCDHNIRSQKPYQITKKLLNSIYVFMYCHVKLMIIMGNCAK